MKGVSNDLQSCEDQARKFQYSKVGLLVAFLRSQKEILSEYQSIQAL